MSATTGPVDWDVAARVGARAARPGPVDSRAGLTALVEGLRSAAGVAAEHVVRTTRLAPADGRAAADISRVIVVDRAGWAHANARVFATMAADVTVPAHQASPRRRALTGVQVGAVLALLSGKVLGQFDPFTPAPGAPTDAPGEGRLLLVAPNVLEVQRALRVDPADFRLWVALHEQTHALQFAAAPWLAAHLRDRSARLLAGLADEQEQSLETVAAGVRRAVSGAGSVLDVLTEEQRTLFDEVGAVMALLEGHADVTMDAVGRTVVPSVRQIRRRFEARRESGARSRGAQRVVRRVLGMDEKLAQYRDGAVFVRAVRSRVGIAAANAVWAAPEHLPTAAEIADPAAWVRRVHG
ncbi:zinc-dependent metalloprotease [Cellulomonas sp.]|uniref:zinc-dependent metalloprotease n=1 Tax=Cellulomonas sp. TaxID=40001 RepID=UPI00258B096A|nr:zinc-dependent metalloprotease [Cellulomonas sp.]MCR6688272.1 zinc-dependent metalloprotease [Cellulomonas sp.]